MRLAILTIALAFALPAPAADAAPDASVTQTDDRKCYATPLGLVCF